MTVISDALLARMKTWIEEGRAHVHVKEPDAVALATVGADNIPSVRMVLLKGLDARGLVIYTNSRSAKGRDMHENARASLLYYCMSLGRQIRVTGTVERASDAESDAYFATRSRESRIGAWASAQSEALVSRDALVARFREFEQKFEGKEVSRPPHWYGFRIVPEEIEFWQEGSHRLHVRELFTRQSDGSWKESLLNP